MFPLASAWALRFDLVPTAAKPAVLEAIRNSGKPNIGGYGGDALYSGLWNAGGMGDFVVNDLARYQPMLAENRANWETFSTGHEVNHAWTAYPGYLFQKYVSGIQPTGGGFSAFDVRPEITGLSFAESTVPTVKGLISTRWEKMGSHRLKLFLTVPANTRATLFMPKVAARVRIKESGAVLWPNDSGKTVPGVLATKDVGTAIKVVLVPGTYHFQETPLIPQSAAHPTSPKPAINSRPRSESTIAAELKAKG